MLKSILCDYSDAYILVRGTITDKLQAGGNNNIQVVFKNCAPFTDCINEINNIQTHLEQLVPAIIIYNKVLWRFSRKH